MFDSNDRIGTWIHVYSFPNVNEDVSCSVFACLLLFYGFAFCLTNLSEMYKWTFFKIKIKKTTGITIIIISCLSYLNVALFFTRIFNNFIILAKSSKCHIAFNSFFVIY